MAYRFILPDAGTFPPARARPDRRHPRTGTRNGIVMDALQVLPK